MTRPNWLLIDGSSLIFRAFFGMKGEHRAPDGRQVNAVRGTLDSLARLVETRRPRSLVVATDEDWRPAFRVDALPGYKAHRVAEPVPPALEPQMPLVMEVLAAFGLNVIGKPGYEAEDVVASLARRLEGPIEVYSGDRDLFGIVRDPDLVVLYPEKTGLAVVDEAEITRRYGIPGRSYADFAVLRGDPSDGLPGVAGVGAKTAAGLIRRYGDLDGIMKAMDWSEATRQYVASARTVVEPVEHLKLPVPQPGLGSAVPDPERLEKLNRELGIRSSSSRLQAALASVAVS
ncbi:MAG: flap endonuclease [Candidatus Dormibacteraeota bacterium]|nr:flap endonuclease [Candidatus Dormibacteraeota bacterium]